MSNIYYGMPVTDLDDRRLGINPAKGEGNYCYDPAEDCALIIERKTVRYHWNKPTETKRSYRILTGSGVSGQRIGDEIGWVTDTGLGNRNDYTGRFKIVGIIEPDGTRNGYIPTRKLPHYVMK